MLRLRLCFECLWSGQDDSHHFSLFTFFMTVARTFTQMEIFACPCWARIGDPPWLRSLSHSVFFPCSRRLPKRPCPWTMPNTRKTNQVNIKRIGSTTMMVVSYDGTLTLLLEIEKVDTDMYLVILCQLGEIVSPGCNLRSRFVCQNPPVRLDTVPILDHSAVLAVCALGQRSWRADWLLSSDIKFCHWYPPAVTWEISISLQLASSSTIASDPFISEQTSNFSVAPQLALSL